MSTGSPSNPQSRSAPSTPSHLLALKVLRAARPTLHHPPIHHYPTQFSLDIPPLPSSEPASCCSLTLPNAFGIIYLGQTFHGLLSVQHEGGQPAENAVLRVEMHTASSKIQLSVVGPRRVEFQNPGLELAVKHEIKELGLHTLVCTVSYDQVDQTNLQANLDNTTQFSPAISGMVSRNFRKLYKFQVSNPLSVKTKVFVPSNAHTATGPMPSTINALFSPTLRHRIYLEVQIQNQTPQPIFFEHVNLVPQPDQAVKLEYADLNLDPSTAQLPRSLAFLSAGDASQFLFSIIQPSEPSASMPVQTLGRLDLAWCGSMGEPGRLQTSALTRKLAQKAPIEETGLGALRPELLVDVIDRASIIVGTPFTVTFLIRLPVPRSEEPLFFTFQHLPPSRPLLDDGERDRTSTPAPTSDWSLKESLASLSSSLLASGKGARSLDTASPPRQSFSDAQLSHRWTVPADIQPPSSTSRLAHRESARARPPMIALGTQNAQIEVLDPRQHEFQVSSQYLALEPGLWALGGVRLSLRTGNEDHVIVGEWPETGYVWCAP